MGFEALMEINMYFFFDWLAAYLRSTQRSAWWGGLRYADRLQLKYTKGATIIAVSIPIRTYHGSTMPNIRRLCCYNFILSKQTLCETMQRYLDMKMEPMYPTPPHFLTSSPVLASIFFSLTLFFPRLLTSPMTSSYSCFFLSPASTFISLAAQHPPTDYSITYVVFRLRRCWGCSWSSYFEWKID